MLTYHENTYFFTLEEAFTREFLGGTSTWAVRGPLEFAVYDEVKWRKSGKKPSC